MNCQQICKILRKKDLTEVKNSRKSSMGYFFETPGHKWKIIKKSHRNGFSIGINFDDPK